MKFTPSKIQWCVAIVFSLAFVTYLGLEVRAFARSPLLLLDYPSLDYTLHEQEWLTIAGQTSRDARVFLNGEELLISSNGFFSDNIYLPEGKHVLHFRAVSRLGKQTYAQKIIERTFRESDLGRDNLSD